MNITELVADLQTKCVWVGTPSRVANSPSYPNPESWTIPVIQIGAGGTYQTMDNYRFTVLNKGMVAGPQVYASDVLDENDVVIHAAGDPILDENGDQVVIPPQLAETCLINQQILTPVGDTMTAVAYLEAERAKGTWLRYVEDDQGPKRPDLSFFAIKAFVDNGGNVSEKRFLIAYDDQGNPFHTEIV